MYALRSERKVFSSFTSARPSANALLPTASATNLLISWGVAERWQQRRGQGQERCRSCWFELHDRAFRSSSSEEMDFRSRQERCRPFNGKYRRDLPLHVKSDSRGKDDRTFSMRGHLTHNLLRKSDAWHDGGRSFKALWRRLANVQSSLQAQWEHWFVCSLKHGRSTN